MLETQITLPADVIDFGLYLADEQDLSPRTVSSYTSDLSLFSRWFEARNPLEPFSADTITQSDIRTYRSHLQHQTHQAPTTINRKLSAIRRFCTWALETHRIDKKKDATAAVSPARDIQLIEIAALTPKALSRGDDRLLLRTVENYGTVRDIAIIKVLRFTGLRVSELRQLRLRDVAISNKRQSVRVSIWGKGNKPATVQLNTEARDALLDYLEIRPQADKQTVKKEEAASTSPLFLNSHARDKGKPLTSRAIQRLVRKYGLLAAATAEASGAPSEDLKTATPHTLRHTFAKGLLDQGVPITRVKGHLRHRHLTTTERYVVATEAEMAADLEHQSYR
jgi:site-specific recombinase XerD